MTQTARIISKTQVFRIYYQQGSSGVRLQPKVAVVFGKIEGFDVAK